MHGECDQPDGVEQIALRVTHVELLILVGSISETLEAVEDWESSTRRGADKAAVRILLAELGDLIARLHCE